MLEPQLSTCLVIGMSEVLTFPVDFVSAPHLLCRLRIDSAGIQGIHRAIDIYPGFLRALPFVRGQGVLRGEVVECATNMRCRVSRSQ